MDARIVWLKFGLTVAGCAVGAAALTYLACAVVLDRVLNQK